MIKKEKEYELPIEETEKILDNASEKILVGLSNEERFQSLEGDIKEIARHLKNLSDRFEELPSEKLQVAKGDEDVLPIKESESENPLLDTILKELSPEFKIEMKPHQPGISFKLVIFAPERLRETKEDKHVKVIPYLEAEAQGKAYARKVKEYHIRQANRKGLGQIFS